MKRDEGYPSDEYKRYIALGFYEPERCDEHFVQRIGDTAAGHPIYGCLLCGVRYAARYSELLMKERR